MFSKNQGIDILKICECPKDDSNKNKIKTQINSFVKQLEKDSKSAKERVKIKFDNSVGNVSFETSTKSTYSKSKNHDLLKQDSKVPYNSLDKQSKNINLKIVSDCEDNCLTFSEAKEQKIYPPYKMSTTFF